jgi:hypothetical protein
MLSLGLTKSISFLAGKRVPFEPHNGQASSPTDFYEGFINSDRVGLHYAPSEGAWKGRMLFDMSRKRIGQADFAFMHDLGEYGTLASETRLNMLRPK